MFKLLNIKISPKYVLSIFLLIISISIFSQSVVAPICGGGFGPCCEGVNFPMPAGTRCGEVLDIQYWCRGTLCGDDIERRTQKETCDGSGHCDAGPEWSSWSIYSYCTELQLCYDSDPGSLSNVPVCIADETCLPTIGNNVWFQATAHANFVDEGSSVRHYFGTWVYDDKMWISSGWGIGNPWKDDVWYSTNGASWTLRTLNAPWPGTYGIFGLVYNNTMWILPSSQTNDIYSSVDGVNWNLVQANPPFGALWGAFVFNDAMHVSVGYNPGVIYKSTNGVDWAIHSPDAPWPGNYIVFNNKVWAVGLGGISYSDDAISWTWVPGSGVEEYARPFVFDNKLYVTSAIIGSDTIKYSSDGITWYEVSGWPGWVGRFGHGVMVYDHKAWVIAGNNWQDVSLDDVWYAFSDIYP